MTFRRVGSPLALPALIAGLAVCLFGTAAHAAESKPEVNAKGFKAPSFKGFKVAGKEVMTDATTEIPGEETKVETFENKAGDRIFKLTTNGVVWAFGIVPGGDPTKGYILRDPACKKKLTEKWAPTAPFSAPDCAVKAKPKK